MAKGFELLELQGGEPGERSSTRAVPRGWISGAGGPEYFCTLHPCHPKPHVHQSPSYQPAAMYNRRYHCHAVPKPAPVRGVIRVSFSRGREATQWIHYGFREAGESFTRSSFSCLSKHKARLGGSLIITPAGSGGAQSSGLLQCSSYTRMRPNASGWAGVRARACGTGIKVVQRALNEIFTRPEIAANAEPPSGQLGTEWVFKYCSFHPVARKLG